MNMNNKLISYMDRYDNLHESLADEMQLTMTQSCLLALARIMLQDGTYDEMDKEEKTVFLDRTIEVLTDFIKVGRELTVGLNTLIMINETIGTYAKKLGYYNMLEIAERNEHLKETIELLTDKSHEEFLQELLELKCIL